MARNPLSDPEGYVGDVPTGRPSFAPGEYPDVRPAELAAEKDALDADAKDAGEADDLSAYAVGGGWYEINGERYHGKAKAQEALDAGGDDD
jgi:hypothetical protein